MTVSNQKLLNRIKDKLKKSEPIYFKLPGEGMLKMEQPVPFLVVYRIPKGGKDYFTSRLGKTESAYLISSEESEPLAYELIHTITSTLSDKFKGFLILEIWLTHQRDRTAFTIHINQKSVEEVAEKLASELNKITIQGRGLKAVLTKGTTSVAPPDARSLTVPKDREHHSVSLIGLEIAPVYIDEVTGQPYPLFLRELRTQFSKALRKSFFEFIRLQTSFNASHFQMLGTTIIDEITLEIDKELATYSKMFEFLFLVTPINVEQAWQDFKKSNFAHNPTFHYRPMPVDPEMIKRKLYNLPIEEITDPTIAFLFRDKRKEIDRMLNMMQEREKPDFLLSSLQLFGPVSDQELEVARALLVAIETTPETHPSKKIDAYEFAEMARAELAWLQLQHEEVSTTVRVADDVEGILVSKSILHINTHFQVSKARAQSLLQHEIGTHIVTYYNGKAQPLELFSIGVPGYEELQEGLAVFAEYLCGGLTAGRMRTLAARAVAVHEMTSGKQFTETFQLLMEKYKFQQRSAFNICMRVYRGGGLTKDAVYLKGLLNIIAYIKKGKDLKQLLIGKIRQDYLPVVQELIHRRILKTAPLSPRYLSAPYLEELAAIKKDGSIFKMIQQ